MTKKQHTCSACVYWEIGTGRCVFPVPFWVVSAATAHVRWGQGNETLPADGQNCAAWKNGSWNEEAEEGEFRLVKRSLESQVEMLRTDVYLMHKELARLRERERQRSAGGLTTTGIPSAPDRQP